MIRTNHLTNSILTAVGFCALLVLPASAVAAEKATPSIETLAEQAASTPAQHEALAAYYRGKADEARVEVKRHQEMAVNFPSKGATGMEAHCRNLADAAQKSATAYDAMAAIHDDQAKSATK